MAAAAEEVPVPPQYKPQPLYDFRAFPDETRGYKVGITKLGRQGTKRKLEEYGEQVARDEAEREAAGPEAAAAAAEAAAAEMPARKRARSNVVGVGKASGRGTWKQPGQRAVTLRNPKLSSSWEKKMAVKATEAAYKAAKREAQAARKEAAAEARRKKEEAHKRKEEARARSAVVTRVSAATAKRMQKSKKGRKLLRTGDAP